FDAPPNVDGSNVDLAPGDTITLYPKNTPEDAQRLINFMDWGSVADTPIDWPASSVPPSLYADQTFTLRHLLINTLDITTVPRRSFLRASAHFATDPDHKERLLEFQELERLDEYCDYTTRPR